MFSVKKLLVFAAVALVHANADLPFSDFSFKVRVLGFGKNAGLFKISYSASDEENAIAIASLSGKQSLNIYQFYQQTHVKIDETSCNIIKINRAELEADPIFPIILNNNGKLIDPNSLLRIDGTKIPLSKDVFQNTETAELKKPKKITIDENNAKKDYDCKIKVTQAGTTNAAEQTVIRVEAVCDTDKIYSYEVFEYTPGISDEDFKIPDGFYCMTQEKYATPLAEITLQTPPRLHFTRRGSEGAMKGWIHSELGVKKEEIIEEKSLTITDMINNVEYKLDKGDGSCTVTTLGLDTRISPGEFLYKFQPPKRAQITRVHVQLGTMKAFVITGYQEDSTEALANIYLSEEPIPAPLRVILTSRNNQFREDFIEGFTDQVSWEEFDVTACLAARSSEVFRIFMSIENHATVGNLLNFQHQTLISLKEWTGIKEHLRFINIQPYVDGSISFEILPKRENAGEDEPTSAAAVAKLVETVKAGRAIFNKPNSSKSRVVLITYETLGAPQATYREGTVVLISLSVSILSILLGLVMAVVFMRNAHPHNYLRRQLRI